MGVPEYPMKKVVFKMHLNPFKAILDQVFFMREAEFFLGNESGGSEEEYANLQYMPYKHNI